MVYKILEIYKRELSVRVLIFKYFNWKLIFPQIILILLFMIVAITLAIAENKPPYFLISVLSAITFPRLLKKVEIERDRILKEVHNDFTIVGIRMRRLKNFLKAEGIDYSKEKLNLLIASVDKQAHELRTPLLVGKGVMAALLVPIWIQGIAWILNKQINSVELFVLFIVVLLLVLLVFWFFLSFYKSVIHDEIINSDFNRLKMISNDLRELQFKE